MIITCDKEDEDKLAQWVRKDEQGNVVELNFPKKLIIMANHQVRSTFTLARFNTC